MFPEDVKNEEKKKRIYNILSSNCTVSGHLSPTPIFEKLFRQPLLIRSLNVFNSLLRRMLIKPKVNAKLYASGTDFDFQSGRIKYQLIKDETFMPTKKGLPDL